MSISRVGKTVVVGGSGMVGRVLLGVMGCHQFIPSQIVVAGKSTVGQTLTTSLGDLVVKPLTREIFANAELVFLAAGAKASREWVPIIADCQRQSKVIDLSSAFRYDDNVPLVIPPINCDDVGDSNLIACPNCTTSIALMVLAPIHRHFEITRVDMASYQAASGAGKQALDDLGFQITEWAQSGQPPLEGTTGSAPYPLAGNLLPRIDTAEPEWQGFTREEMKTYWESRKILFKRDVPVYATCVRVPVQRCHSEVLTVRTVKRAIVKELRPILSDAFGVKLLDDVANDVYPMPLNLEGVEEVGVGRIRITPSGEIIMWVCGDQLLRGAALTAVEIAEFLFP